MNWNRIRITACLTAAVFLHGVLSGCSGQEQSSPAGNASSSTIATTAVGYSLEQMDFTYSDRDMDGTWSTDGAVAISLSGNSAAISGNGAAVKDGVLTITAAGTYVLSGSFEGRVVISAAETDKIQLVLNGASVSCENHAALFVEQADKVFLTLAEGTENSLSDGSSYTLASGEENVDGAVFSRADLTINGSGALTVTANCANGIVSKDDMVITGGTIAVNAAEDGLQGKDCVKICGGTLNIKAGGDGIKSSNAEDAAKGFVTLDGGTLTITAENDGVQAETVLRVTGGGLSITTGGGSANAVQSSQGGEMPGGTGRGSFGSTVQETAVSTSTAAEEESTSAKGLKAGGLVLVESGTVTADSADDTVHSNGGVNINAGALTLATGDDGVHADEALAVTGGEITVSKSYEGLEGATIDISGGTILVTASDDGLNATGSGTSGSGMGGGMQADNSASLQISGGYLVVDASGDGLDSNGNLTISGGTVLVSGPTNDGNGALDYNGTGEISGGVVVCAGSRGMAQSFSNSSAQASLMYTFSTAKEAETLISLTDSSGAVLASFAPGKAYQNVVVSAPGLKQGSSYSLVAGGSIAGADSNGFAASGTVSGGTKTADVTLSGVSTSAADEGVSTGGMNGGMGGANGGTPPSGTVPGGKGQRGQPSE